jgi:hypothetical protein
MECLTASKGGDELRTGSSWRLALLTLAAIGCSEPETTNGRFTVMDSAGVIITESSTPAWGREDGWVLTATAETEIGRDTDDPGQQFHDIVGTTGLPDAGIAVVDRGSQMLRLFDNAGELVATAGGEGQGPGEFRYIWSMAWSGRDTLFVMDESAIEVFSTSGDHLGSYSRQGRSSLLEEPGVGINPLLVNPDGSILAMVFEPRAGRTRPINKPFRPAQGWALFFAGFDEEAAFLGWYPGYLLERIKIGSETVQLSPPFHTATYVARGAIPLQIVIGDSEVAEVRVFDASGRLIRISRWQGHRRAVESGWVEAWKEQVRYEEGAQRQLALLEVAWSRMHVPDRLPLFQALAVDAEGNAWARRAQAPTDSVLSYEVIDAEGRWLGTVDVPPGLIHTVDHPVDIGPDYFLGIWQDDIGIQSVRRYGLLKPGASPP